MIDIARHTNIASARTFASVPPVGRSPVSKVGTGGTVYPLSYRDSEFNALADEIASGEWVDVKDIGKIQIVQEEANSVLTSFGKDGKRIIR